MDSYNFVIVGGDGRVCAGRPAVRLSNSSGLRPRFGVRPLAIVVGIRSPDDHRMEPVPAVAGQFGGDPCSPGTGVAQVPGQ